MPAILKIPMSGYCSYISGKEAKNKTEDKYREKIRGISDEGRGTYVLDRAGDYEGRKVITASYESW